MYNIKLIVSCFVLFFLELTLLLCQVWLLMAATSPPQLMVFELYYGDTLVAADFAHPICGGRSVYVATRFSARGHSKTSSLSLETQDETSNLPDESEIRTMQPGFILALVECRWLQERGCEMWDLGGYNLSPLMQYKLDLAGQPQSRPFALHEFRQLVQDSRDQHPWSDPREDLVSSEIDCSMLSSVRSGDVLLEDVKIGHLLGHYRP